MNRGRALSILRERSTIAGIVGAVVAVFGLVGWDVDEALVSEIMLLLISIVAIMTRPEKHDDRGGAGVDRVFDRGYEHTGLDLGDEQREMQKNPQRRRGKR